MSIFSFIGHFFLALFNMFRPEAEKFIHKYQDIAIEQLDALAKVNDGKAFHDWKDQAFNTIKAEVLKDFQGELHDNWISMLVDFAFEIYKQKQTNTPIKS